MPRNYVDNAYNRSIGRVGMPVGSMVVSRGASGSSSTSGGGGYSYNAGSSGRSASSGYSSTSASSSTYVDNAFNRRVGRVGMEKGTAVISQSGSTSTSSTDSTKTYVDNDYNRSVGRVGMPHGSMVIPKSDGLEHNASESSYTGQTSPFNSNTKPNAYVDSPQNRQLGRVGLEHGAAPVDKGQNLRIYKDNALNRRLGRVGKLVGTAVFNKSTGTTSVKTYVDNPENRKLDRVGVVKGCRPSPKKSQATKQIKDFVGEQVYDERDNWQFANPYDFGFEDEIDVFGDINTFDEYAAEQAACQINRRMLELEWMKEHGDPELPRTEEGVIEAYTGTEIPYDDLLLQKKIGQGAFGDVYFAKWKGTVVAVKKLRVDRISKSQLQDFSKEIKLFYELDHENIVKFIGACVEQPDLCIVMEYMQMSLFDAVHIKAVEFSEDERRDIILQMSKGLRYLHEEKIAHCDLKSQNILLDYESTKTHTAKITDFGLAMLKAYSETSSASSTERVQHAGTPKYSAPEILRGEMLNAAERMMADVYALGLVVFEVIYEEEPFYDLTQVQLEKQIGEKGIKQQLPGDVLVKKEVEDMLQQAWSFRPLDRPTAENFLSAFQQSRYIFE